MVISQVPVCYIDDTFYATIDNASLLAEAKQDAITVSRTGCCYQTVPYRCKNSITGFIELLKPPVAVLMIVGAGNDAFPW